MAASYAYAIFSARYAPLSGGVESFTQRLAAKLAACGNRVFVVTSQLDGSPSRETQADGVEVYRLPARAPLGPRLPLLRKDARCKEMLDELAAQGVDRVLVNTRFYQLSLEGVRFARRIGAPVIVLDHGSAHLTMGNPIFDWFIERYEHAVTRSVIALHPAFAGISRASVAWLEHFGIETDLVIGNAIDVDEYRAAASDRDFRRELDAEEGRTLVAFVGRLEPEKGALEFAQAAQLLGDSFVCVMAGDGSLRSAIESLEQGPRLLGRVDQATLSALLRDSDVFCLPSRSEGLCTSLLEAAAQGAIPVMTHVGGTDEVMGWDPVRLGAGLESKEPAAIAAAIEGAASMSAQQAKPLEQHVREQCSWDATVASLEAAFDSLS